MSCQSNVLDFMVGCLEIPKEQVGCRGRHCAHARNIRYLVRGRVVTGFVAWRGKMAQSLKDRVLGSLLGLAVGDALGTTVEFMPPGSFEEVTGMQGGGKFSLQPIF